jgi:hypothetical protein
MTEPNTAIEPDSTWSNDDYAAAADAHLAAQDDDKPDGGAQDDQEAKIANRREASYRIRAREAEAAATVLEERVTRMQRAEVERMAARLHDPADLWGAGVDLLELLNEDGEVDPERVAEAVAALTDSKPYLLKPPRGSNFGQGNRTPVDMGSGTTWGSVLSGR